MKDAQGHGSNGRSGASALVARGQASAAHQFKIQQINTNLAGNSWQTVKRVGFSPNSTRPAAKAERIAQGMRIDNANAQMRVR